jgi:hypothetical protein
VICRNTAAARLGCDVLFKPGTWTVAGTAIAARASLWRHHRLYARGTARITRGKHRIRIRLTAVRRLHHGSYSLRIKLGKGRHATMLRQKVRIGRPT